MNLTNDCMAALDWSTATYKDQGCTDAYARFDKIKALEAQGKVLAAKGAQSPARIPEDKCFKTDA